MVCATIIDMLSHRWAGRRTERTEQVARFGSAELVRLDGQRFELRGGDLKDRTAAKEWIALFLHEAVPVWRPGQATDSARC